MATFDEVLERCNRHRLWLTVGIASLSGWLAALIFWPSGQGTMTFGQASDFGVLAGPPVVSIAGRRIDDMDAPPPVVVGQSVQIRVEIPFGKDVDVYPSIPDVTNKPRSASGEPAVPQQGRSIGSSLARAPFTLTLEQWELMDPSFSPGLDNSNVIPWLVFTDRNGVESLCWMTILADDGLPAVAELTDDNRFIIEGSWSPQLGAENLIGPFDPNGHRRGLIEVDLFIAGAGDGYAACQRPVISIPVDVYGEGTDRSMLDDCQ